MPTMNILLRRPADTNDEPHAVEGASPSPSQTQDCQKADVDVRLDAKQLLHNRCIPLPNQTPACRGLVQLQVCRKRASPQPAGEGLGVGVAARTRRHVRRGGTASKPSTGKPKRAALEC